MVFVWTDRIIENGLEKEKTVSVLSFFLYNL